MAGISAMAISKLEAKSLEVKAHMWRSPEWQESEGILIMAQENFQFWSGFFLGFFVDILLFNTI